MSRWSHYDTDEERLPEGMTRVGYDADSQVYTFRDADGTCWESAPGNQYGRLQRVGDADPFPHHLEGKRDAKHDVASWRAEMMPLLNFLVLVCVTLLVLVYFLGRGTAETRVEQQQQQQVVKPGRECDQGSVPYTVLSGDTCWGIAVATGTDLESLLGLNPGIDCDAMQVRDQLCV